MNSNEHTIRAMKAQADMVHARIKTNEALRRQAVRSGDYYEADCLDVAIDCDRLDLLSIRECIDEAESTETANDPIRFYKRALCEAKADDAPAHIINNLHACLLKAEVEACLSTEID